MNPTFDRLLARVHADEFGWPSRRSVLALSRSAEVEFGRAEAVARLVDAFATLTEQGWDLSWQAARSHRFLVGRAGLDLADEQAVLLRRTVLVNGPAHIPARTWSELRPGLRRLLAWDSSARRGFADLIVERGGPALSGGPAFWLPILLETGVLWDISASAANSPDECADLLAAFLADPGCPVTDDRLLCRLVQVLGPTAVPAHRPVYPGATDRGLNLAVLDELLGVGLDPDLREQRAVDVRRWATDPHRGSLRNLDRGTGLDDVIEAGIDAHVLDPPRRRESVGPLLDGGLRPHVERWLREYGGAVDGDSSLVVVHESLRRLHRALGAGVLVDLPDVRRSLTLLDLGEPLLRMFRTGLVDEFSWPALDEALIELDVTRLRWSACWPGLVVHDTRLALVVGPDRLVARHRLRCPADLPPKAGPLVGFVTGQFLVCWPDEGAVRGYWSADARVTFELTLHWPVDGAPDVFATAIAHPDGLVLGDRALRTGATTIGRYLTTVGSDGASWWRVTNPPKEHGAPVVVSERFDPITGTALAEQVPPPLAEYVVEGTAADLLTTELLPAAGAPPTSPLGWAPGWVGVLARQRLNDDASHDIELQGPDGRTVTVRLGAGVFNPYLVTSGILRFPEADDDWLLVGDDQLLAVGDRMTATAFLGLRIGPVDPTDTAIDRPATMEFIPPGRFWHHFRARDRAGSAALRTIDRAQVDALRDAATHDLSSGDRGRTSTRRAIAAQLPAITDPGLVHAVGELLHRTPTLERQLSDVAAHFR